METKSKKYRYRYSVSASTQIKILVLVSVCKKVVSVHPYFKPLRRSVLPMVFLVTVVPAALRSFPSSPCVVLGLFCTFRMIIDTARGDILHGAPERERLTVVWCCFHLRIIAPIEFLLFGRGSNTFFASGQTCEIAGGQILIYNIVFKHTHLLTLST